MSKYEELSELACRYVEEDFAVRDSSRDLGGKVSIGYCKYLGVPEGKTLYSKLTRDLEIEERSYGFGSHPKVVRGNDMVWYFGLTILWEHTDSRAFLEETIKIGVYADSEIKTSV